jgi:aminotransferase
MMVINIFQPSLDNKELDALKDVFESNWVGRGPKTEKFEIKFAEKIGVDSENVCTVGGCTQGINAILEILNLDEDAEVIVPSLSFIGIANSVVRSGAKVVFCDVDERTMNVNLEYISKVVTNNTKVLILIHYGGYPCTDMDEIIEFCNSKNIKIIEDNACSPFSKYKGKNTGVLADFGVWSFDAMKVMTTGDGGMIYCKDIDTMTKLRKHLYFGLTSKSGLSNKVDTRWWEFDVIGAGGKFVVNDIISTIGLEQLKKVDGFVERRKEVADFYSESFSKLDWVKVPPNTEGDVHSCYYMYWVQFDNQTIRDGVATFLRDNDVYTTFRYYPLHWIDFYKELVGETTSLKNTESAAVKTLCLPLHPSLSNSDIKLVVNLIEEYTHEL